MDNIDLIVIEPSIEGVADRWFIVDYRDQSGYPVHHWHIHSGTVSWKNLLSNIEWVTRNDRSPFMVFQAKNRSQVRDWMIHHGYVTQWGGVIHQPEESDMPRIGETVTPGRARFLQRRIDVMQAELERLESMPPEPVPEDEDDDTTVIAWDARFKGGTTIYSYAARKAADGLWYTTGPRSEQGYSWSDLIIWIADTARPVDGMIWIATEFESEPLP